MCFFWLIVCEKFRKVCSSVYQVDPAHFYSAPNLSWESMLVLTRVKLELLEDVHMLLFFERYIWGGINGVRELRQFTANSPHLNTFNPGNKTTFGAFYAVTVTSLYAGTMQKNDASGKLQMKLRNNCQTNFGNSRKF